MSSPGGLSPPRGGTLPEQPCGRNHFQKASLFFCGRTYLKNSIILQKIYEIYTKTTKYLCPPRGGLSPPRGGTLPEQPCGRNHFQKTSLFLCGRTYLKYLYFTENLRNLYQNDIYIHIFTPCCPGVL